MLASPSLIRESGNWKWPMDKPRRWIKLGRPLAENEIADFETRLKRQLPTSYRKLLTYANGLKSYDRYDIPFKETQKQFKTEYFTRPTLYGIDQLGTANRFFPGAPPYT